jgi:ankyrin repeat protein
MAVVAQLIDMITYLTEKSADVNSKDENGETALHMVIKTFDIPAIKILLATGAASNARSRDGNSPLHHFASSRLVIALRSGSGPSQRTPRSTSKIRTAKRRSTSPRLLVTSLLCLSSSRRPRT